MTGVTTSDCIVPYQMTKTGNWNKIITMKKLFTEIPLIEDDRIILRKIIDNDAAALDDLIHSEIVYHYEPTYLFERQFTDVHEMIRNLYGECFEKKQNLILGIEFKEKGQLSGIAEFYDYKEHLHMVSIGYRLRKGFWNNGIATESAKMMADYLFNQTDVEIITASTMIENRSSAHVLEKNGFLMTSSGNPEDWGHKNPTMADRWFL